MCNPVTDLNGKEGGCASDGFNARIGKVGEEWKKIIQDNFLLWLEEISNLENLEPTGQEPPDFESFFKELCVLRAEFRKGARRSHETFVRFGETLAEFDRTTQSILSKLSELERQKEREDILSKKRTYLPLVEIFERFKRMEGRLLDPPRGGLFSRKAAWEKAWEALHGGFEILRSHLEGLLKSEGITAVETVGKPFDPTIMVAVEAEETSSFAPGTVMEEFSSGYLYHGQPLKLAEVKVAKSKGGEAWKQSSE